MSIMYACTKIEVHACTMIIAHVSCPIWLMSGVIEGGGLGGEAPQMSRRVWGAARPPNICPVTRFEDLPGKNRLPGFENYPVTRFFLPGCCLVLSEWPVWRPLKKVYRVPAVGLSFFLLNYEAQGSEAPLDLEEVTSGDRASARGGGGRRAGPIARLALAPTLPRLRTAGFTFLEKLESK